MKRSGSLLESLPNPCVGEYLGDMESRYGGSIPLNGKLFVRHENCWWTSQADVCNLCGEHSIALYYDYQREPFAGHAPGQITLVSAGGAHCLIYYEPVISTIPAFFQSWKTFATFVVSTSFATIPSLLFVHDVGASM